MTVTAHQAGAETERLNILILIADDMGFSDVGAFGSEIETPSIVCVPDNVMLPVVAILTLDLTSRPVFTAST